MDPEKLGERIWEYVVFEINENSESQKELLGRQTGSLQRLKIWPQRIDMFWEAGGMKDVIKFADNFLQILENVTL